MLLMINNSDYRWASLYLNNPQYGGTFPGRKGHAPRVLVSRTAAPAVVSHVLTDDTKDTLCLSRDCDVPCQTDHLALS